MGTAKLFNNGRSQAVRLPREYRFNGNEVGIKKVGKYIMLYPIDDLWNDFLQVPPASDDFGDAIHEARRVYAQTPRETI